MHLSHAHRQRRRAALAGIPFFTTDSAAALRAAEIGAQAFLKGTQVDGIYDSDPKHNPAACRYSHLSYRKCVVDDLKVPRATMRLAFARLAVAMQRAVPLPRLAVSPP